MTISGVNYESYNKDWKVIKRSKKLFKCYVLIKWLINNRKINKNNYSYLLQINNYVMKNIKNFKSENKLYRFLQKNVGHGFKTLFRIK
jgi:hypothetical protein